MFRGFLKIQNKNQLCRPLVSQMSGSASSAVTILSPPPSGGRLQLDQEKIRQIFCTSANENLPAAIISVAGAMRTGKSFLLDYLLRRLQETHLETKSSSSLSGFPWRCGMNRHTSGIQIYPEPIIVNGVAVYLMDTQGTFDHRTTVRDNMTIFAMACLTSSHLIYNLMHIIREDHLQNLQLFTEYGRLVSESYQMKPFQQLMFLVRDWHYPQDAGFGFEGGRFLLHNVMDAEAGSNENFTLLRNHIASSFESIDCFLLPYPGPRVAEDPNFKGEKELLDPRFSQHLNELAESILSPTNLKPKKIGGRVVKSKDIYDYFLKYMEIFSGDTLPEPKSIYETTADLVHIHALKESKNLYAAELEDNLSVNSDTPFTEDDLSRRHLKAKQIALLHFMDTAKFGDEKKRKLYENSLVTEISKHYETIRSLNDARISNKFHQARDQYCLHFNSRFKKESAVNTGLLKTFHLEAVELSDKVFKNDQGLFYSKSLAEELSKYFEIKYKDYIQMNHVKIHLKIKEYEEECLSEYSKLMESVLTGPFSINAVKLEYEHKNAKREIIDAFSRKDDFGTNLLVTAEPALEKMLDEKLIKFKKMNEDKHLHVRLKKAVSQLGDNETYRAALTEKKYQAVAASSLATILVLKTYFGS